MVMTDDTTGPLLTVANIDQVNLPPLHGYYAPGCGQATMVGACKQMHHFLQRRRSPQIFHMKPVLGT
jgi:hypothetical protein